MSFQAWHSQNEPAPQGAFQAGWEPDRSPLYAARAHVGSAITPAKVGPSCGRGALYVSDWKEQYVGKDYEVFVSDGQDLAWKDASGVPDPNLNLLEFGTDAGGNPLYLAQIPHESGALCVGKAGPSLADGAHYGYGGKELVAENYKVLCRK